MTDHPAPRATPVAFVLGLAGLAASCSGEREQAQRREAGAIVRAVELVRGAPPGQRGPLLEALVRVPCSEDALCAARKVCVEAYTLERASLDAVATLRRAAEGVVPPGADGLLRKAEEDLALSRDLARRCADDEGEIRRRYALR